MSDVYTGKDQDRKYTGEDIDITFSLKRCIHAENCVNRLSEVFDVKKRPWINPDGTSADRAAEVIASCPSGALHFERKDGGAAEAIPETNRVILWENGPLQLVGDLQIEAAGVNIKQETRATLCRCGASEHKPFCDNTHKETGFTAETVAPVREASAEEGGKLRIIAHANGPLELQGNLTIADADGSVIYSGSKTFLCRCGGSSSKPFCDGTHNKNGFAAE